MTIGFISAASYFRLAITDRYPGREVFAPVPLSSLPDRQLPAIRYALKSIQPRYPGHLFIPGRDEAKTFEPYTIIQHNSVNELPVLCAPQSGTLWVNDDMSRGITHYPLFKHACISCIDRDWYALVVSINANRRAPTKYPTLWNVTLATAIVKPGAIVELIYFPSDFRIYAAITELIAIDPENTLFRAQILGTPGYAFPCLVTVATVLIDPDLCASVDKYANDIGPVLNQHLPEIIARGGNILYPDVVMSAAVLEHYISLESYMMSEWIHL